MSYFYAPRLTPECYNGYKKPMSSKSAAKLVKDARIAKGLTQTELAEKTGVHSNTIAKIEQGIQQPSYPTIKKLSKVLDININDFPE